MTQPVIDTLRLADRLKESGFQDTQAEGLARALGGEFVDHIVTKADLDSGIKLVRADYRVLDEKIDALDDKLETRLGALDEKFEARFGALDGKIDALDDKLETRLGALDEKFEARFGALDEKIGALDRKVETRIDSLGRQITFVFAALAALLALGLIDTVQRLLG